MSHSGLLYTVYRMSHSEFCRIQHCVSFGVMSFSIMPFGIMSHSGLCRSALCHIWHYIAFIQTYVIQDCVVRCNVVRPTVAVSKLNIEYFVEPVKFSKISSRIDLKEFCLTYFTKYVKLRFLCREDKQLPIFFSLFSHPHPH